MSESCLVLIVVYLNRPLSFVLSCSAPLSVVFVGAGVGLWQVY